MNASRVPGLASRTLLASRSAPTSSIFNAGSPPGQTSLTTGAARNGPSTARSSNHSVVLDRPGVRDRRKVRVIGCASQEEVHDRCGEPQHLHRGVATGIAAIAASRSPGSESRRCCHAERSAVS